MKTGQKRRRFNVKHLEKYQYVDSILDYLKETVKLELGICKIEKHLKFCKGVYKQNNKNMNVAIVGYGGTGKDLRDLPTPLQTELLPVIFRNWHEVSKGDKIIPLIVLGHSFDEVFLRKMRILNVAIPDLRLIQFINVNRFNSRERRLEAYKEYCNDKLTKSGKIKNEVNDFHSAMVDYLQAGGVLNGRKYHVLDCEVPAGEGTVKSEVIDILALEKKRRWITVIELKFEKLNNARLQSAIFQGLDYCNWVEDHKRGLAMLFPEYNIDTRRRTRLILINGPEKFPEFHSDFAKSCKKKDRYQEIELSYTKDSYPLCVDLFIKTHE